MKNNLNFLGETLISLFLVGLLIFFVNPLDLLMPKELHLFMIPTLVLLFVVFTAIIWKEKAADEREQLHRYIAARFAYFASITVLVLGIIYQSAYNAVDPWLIIAVCVILLSKLIGLVYGHFRH
ncbi:MAG: hypothetical protein HY344_02145 [Candidatus Levybacteria bacterium]|nr:hypothetical protein [Candidatus Levybacteria bacterium]